MTCGLLVKKLRLKKSTSTNYLPTPRKRQVNPKQSNYTLPRGPHTQRFLPVWRQTEKLSSTHEPHEHELISRNCNIFYLQIPQRGGMTGTGVHTGPPSTGRSVDTHEGWDHNDSNPVW